ncbi:EF-hand domain-containing protein [Marilutibacter alkalisoli]|nr:EF-hand domain-containing protein [Lysobacter alkalisoli]
MNRPTLITAVVLAALAAGTTVAAAQDAPTGKGERGLHIMKLDANGDGAIDRAEAAGSPRLAERFDTLDSNGDGRLTRNELPGHKGKGHRGHRGGHGGIDRIIALDADGDGRISKVEAAGSRHLAERFDDIDGNRDGYIVRSELRAHHEKMRDEFKVRMDERQKQKFDAADTNNDGRLSRAEVEAGMPHLAKAFNFLDENRDGHLSREEAKPMGGFGMHRGGR